MAYSVLVVTLACFFGRIFSMENEPKCYSRFDYEMKLLEKTLQNDIQMKQVLEKLDNTLKAVEVEKAEFHEANERLKTLIDEFKENTSTELLSKLQYSFDGQNKLGVVKIVANGDEVQSIVKYNDAASYTTTSGTTVQSLEKKTQVWVKEDGGNSIYYDSSGYGWNQFSGVLLHH